jgi:hypothetical protein
MVCVCVTGEKGMCVDVCVCVLCELRVLCTFF